MICLYSTLCDTVRNLMIWNITPEANLMVADQQKLFCLYQKNVIDIDFLKVKILPNFTHDEIVISMLVEIMIVNRRLKLKLYSKSCHCYDSDLYGIRFK